MDSPPPCDKIVPGGASTAARDLKPFHLACIGGRLEEAQRISDTLGLTSEDVRSTRNFPLCSACMKGHLDIAKWLTERFELGAEDVRAWDYKPMQEACTFGHLGVVQWLVERFGVSPGAVRTSGALPLQVACEHGHIETASWLLRWMGITGDEEREYLAKAEKGRVLDLLRYVCWKGWLCDAKRVVEENCLTAEEVRSKDNLTLFSACEGGHLEVVEWLVERYGFVPDDGRYLDNLILAGSCVRRHVELTRWLLDWIRPDEDERAELLWRLAHEPPEARELIENWIPGQSDTGLERQPDGNIAETSG